MLKPDGAELMAVVKADAYGHGDVAVARAALEAGAAWIGVALVEEGLRLRDAGIDAPILVLSEFPPGSETVALGAGLTPSLYSDGALRRLAAAAGGRDVGVHVKIDTGMHRAGVYPPEATPPFVERLIAAGLRLEALWTHFASSAEDEKTTLLQLERFLATVEDVRAAGVEPTLLHAANSARHDPVSGDPSRPGPNGDRDLRAGAGSGCRRRAGAPSGARRGAPRSSGRRGCPRGNASRTDTATGWIATRTWRPCRWATPTATLTSCRLGRTS